MGRREADGDEGDSRTRRSHGRDGFGDRGVGSDAGEELVRGSPTPHAKRCGGEACACAGREGPRVPRSRGRGGGTQNLTPGRGRAGSRKETDACPPPRTKGRIGRGSSAPARSRAVMSLFSVPQGPLSDLPTSPVLFPPGGFLSRYPPVPLPAGNSGERERIPRCVRSCLRGDPLGTEDRGSGAVATGPPRARERPEDTPCGRADPGRVSSRRNGERLRSVGAFPLLRRTPPRTPPRRGPPRQPVDSPPGRLRSDDLLMSDRKRPLRETRRRAPDHRVGTEPDDRLGASRSG